jgi:hypothetical protein
MGSKQVENVYCDFTKPTGGSLFLFFQGLAGFPSSTGQNVHLKIAFYLNGSYLSTAEVAEANTPGHSSTLTMQSTLNMQRGDQIWLQILSIHQVSDCGTTIITIIISLVFFCTKKCLSCFNLIA